MFRKSVLLTVLVVIAILFAGCGGGSDDVSWKSNDKEQVAYDDISATEQYESVGAEMRTVPPVRKIVVFEDSVSIPNREIILKKNGLQINKHLKLVNAVSVTVPDSAAGTIKNSLLKFREVKRVDDDIVITAFGRVRPSPTPTPAPAQVTPWGISYVKANLCWSTTSGQAVPVAVIDTGIDLDHPDLAANIKGGYNAINVLASYDDDNGHGSHCAGIIAAVDNGCGVVGVAPKVNLYSVKVLNRKGSGYLSDYIEALQWCIDNKIKVASISSGSSGDNVTFHEAFLKAYQAGIIIIASAGNNNQGAVTYPAKYPEVICVSAIDSSGSAASFSSKGPEVDVAAPGVSVYSTYFGGGYKYLSGTSMACPHVSGIIALKVYLNSALTPDQAAASLKQTAVYSSSLTPEQQGAGVVDAQKFVQY